MPKLSVWSVPANPAGAASDFYPPDGFEWYLEFAPAVGDFVAIWVKEVPAYVTVLTVGCVAPLFVPI